MRETNYSETSTDYQRYYSNCVFLSKDKNSIFYTFTKLATFDLQAIKNEDDEDDSIEFLEVGNLEYYTIDIEDYNNNNPIEGIVATKYSLDFCKKDTVVVHPEQLSFYKIIGSYGINQFGELGHIKFANVGTYKKGMYKDDYFISPCLKSDWYKHLFNKISFPKRDELYRKIDLLFEGKLDYVLLTNRYAITKDTRFRVPTLEYLGVKVGHLNGPDNIKVITKGRIAKNIESIINERGRKIRNFSPRDVSKEQQITKRKYQKSWI